MIESEFFPAGYQQFRQLFPHIKLELFLPINSELDLQRFVAAILNEPYEKNRGLRAMLRGVTNKYGADVRALVVSVSLWKEPP